MKPLNQLQISQLRNKFVTAQQAHQSGFIARAESLYREVLKQMPDAWDVHHHLAIVLATTSRPQEAVKHFRLIVKANPIHATSHANLANALSEAGQFADAISEFRRAIALDSSLTGARIALGETLRRTKQYDEAINCFKHTLELDKVNHAAFNGLGLAYRDLDDLPRALKCFEHAVGLAPKNADYRANFGTTLRSFNLHDLAAEQLLEAITLKPDWLDVIVLLAEVLQEQRRFDEAKEVFDRAQYLSPNNPELIERIGYVYLDMGDTQRAISEFNNVLSEHPHRLMALLGLGRSHMEAGRTKEAIATLESLIQYHPDESSGYFHLAASRKFSPEDPLIPQLQILTNKTAKQSDSSTVAFNFALGKIYDDCKNWDAAFKHYARGNYLRNAECDYNPARHEADISALIKLFNRQLIETCHSLGVDSKLPVFIVGMPRSGTTLTEQIISSHPSVIGAGEVVFWGHAPNAIPYMLNSSQEYPECIKQMTPPLSHEIANKYTNLLHKIAGPSTAPLRITDKMPQNFVHLGLIALLFPNAPIIHCKRDAMDNCLSIFFQNFDAGHPYAFDLENLGHYHKQYERLMKHWHEVLPGRILDINYEDTIADPEYWSHKLIEHIGLEWNDACLAPHKLERNVKTASHWQVRQPIYTTSVQRWKNYENHLDSLKKALA